MSDRRGPDYVRPEVWRAKEVARRRRLRWIMGPLAIVAGVALGLAIWIPMRSSDERLKQMILAVPQHRDFHAVERRDGDETGVLREEYVHSDLRRYILLDGEVELLSTTHGGQFAYEKSSGMVRRHQNALLTLSALERLLKDCMDATARVSTDGNGALVVELERRRYEIQLNQKYLPTEWKTLYLTDKGFEPLWETTVQYGEQDPQKFAAGITPSSPPVDMIQFKDPRENPVAPTAMLGDIEVSRVDVNRFGDVHLLLRSPYERPFLEVSDGLGARRAPISMFAASYRTRGLFQSETMAVRLGEDPVKWPLKVTIHARNYDPRFKVDNFPNKVVGSLTLTFKNPTCSVAPLYWFEMTMSDRSYFDYLRTRAYRLSMVFQNAMRSKSGEFVDAMNSGAANIPEQDLKKNPVDAERAIRELRKVIRLRAEFDGGTLPMAALYVQLATNYLAAGQRDNARAAIAFAQERVRSDRVDAGLVADIERIAKEASQ